MYVVGVGVVVVDVASAAAENEADWKGFVKVDSETVVVVQPTSLSPPPLSIVGCYNHFGFVKGLNTSISLSPRDLSPLVLFGLLFH